MSEFQYFKNLSITAKFILWFLFIALAPLSIATYISYNNSRAALENEAEKNLITVADNKTNQVMFYLREKERNVTALSHSSDIIDAIEGFSEAFYKEGVMDSPEYEAIDRQFRPFFTYYKNSFGYDDLFLIHPKGDIIFSAEERNDNRSLYEVALYENSELTKVFIEVTKSLKTEISDFEYYKDNEKAALFIAAPVFKGPDIIGVVALQMNNEGVCELMEDYAGLGETGEATVVSKIGNEAVFVTPPRFDPEAAFRKRIAIGSEEGIYIQKAVEGKTELGTYIDYRGREALVVSKYIPSFRWAVVLKMDTAEIFASADQLRDRLLKVSLALLVIVVIAAVFIAHSVASPIKELTKVSSTIAEGNLSSRASVEAEDEIGGLARSFNQMTDSLVEANANIEQKRAELEEQKKLLEKANQELDSFAYTASHDLRAPLRGIASFSSFLEEDYGDKLDEAGLDYLREIRDSADRMNNLIEDLLALSRISRVQNPYEDVDINNLISSVIKRIKFDIKESKVDLSIQKDIPIIRCDRIKMAEVFLNLINNAIKFSSKNNMDIPRVGVGYSDKGEFHEFYVKDNGIGIDPKYHKDIFGIFKRLHKASEYEGTGAGLSIVKRVIDDHGGDIRIDSEVGKGTVFYFTIPKLKREQKTDDKG